MAGSTAHGAFAFCDLAGFTAFTADRGDDAAIELVETFRVHVEQTLPPGARIVNRIGDGLLVHFSDPSNAVSCLLGARQLTTHMMPVTAKARRPPVG